MKPSRIELELLFQILSLRADLNGLRADLNGLLVALDRRLDNPQQMIDWSDDFREGVRKARCALLQSLESREATLAAHLRDFLDQEN